MNNTQQTLDEHVAERIPFLENFPFSEFSLSAASMPVVKKGTQTKSVDLISFECENGIKASINVFEKEIWFLNSISDNVNLLNDIKSIIDKGLESTNLLEKRDAILACEAWTETFDPESEVKFNYGTFVDILNAMLELKKTVNGEALVEIINKLHQKKGIVRLDEEQEKLILNYYQFQLIYFKMVLGIIIASKISV